MCGWVGGGDVFLSQRWNVRIGHMVRVSVQAARKWRELAFVTSLTAEEFRYISGASNWEEMCTVPSQFSVAQRCADQMSCAPPPLQNCMFWLPPCEKKHDYYCSAHFCALPDSNSRLKSAVECSSNDKHLAFSRSFPYSWQCLFAGRGGGVWMLWLQTFGKRLDVTYHILSTDYNWS